MAGPRDDFPLEGMVAVPTAAGKGSGPGASYGVCELCCGPARPGCRLCWSCLSCRLALGRRLWPVHPVFLTGPQSGAHAALLAYKAAPSGEVRRRAAAALSGLLAEWLRRHAACVSGDGHHPVGLVPVPSTRGGRPSWRCGHPLEGCVADALARPGSPQRWSLTALLEPSSSPPARLAPSAGGFVVGSPVKGRLLVVIDDLFVSGARATSAAAALERAGASVAGIVCLSRFVRPEHGPVHAAYWASVSRHPAELRRCARHGRRPDREEPALSPAAGSTSGRVLAAAGRSRRLRLAA